MKGKREELLTQNFHGKPSPIHEKPQQLEFQQLALQTDQPRACYCKCSCRPEQKSKTQEQQVLSLPPFPQTLEHSEPGLDAVAQEVFGVAWKAAVSTLWKFETQFSAASPEKKEQLMTEFITYGFHSKH